MCKFSVFLPLYSTNNKLKILLDLQNRIFSVSITIWHYCQSSLGYLRNVASVFLIIFPPHNSDYTFLLLYLYERITVQQMCNEENKQTFYSLQPEGEVIIYFKNGIVLYIKIRITHNYIFSSNSF